MEGRRRSDAVDLQRRREFFELEKDIVRDKDVNSEGLRRGIITALLVMCCRTGRLSILTEQMNQPPVSPTTTSELISFAYSEDTGYTSGHLCVFLALRATWQRLLSQQQHGDPMIADGLSHT